VTGKKKTRDTLDSVGFLLQRAHHRYREAIVAALAGSGFNPGQLAILAALAKANGVTQRDLIAATGIEKSSMVIFLDRLEEEGWVERRAHAQDRRAHAVHLTKEGKSRLATLGPRLDAIETDFLSALDGADRRKLVDLLRRVGE
jgi:DNA-binding MarR family transcriptional regulator